MNRVAPTAHVLQSSDQNRIRLIDAAPARSAPGDKALAELGWLESGGGVDGLEVLEWRSASPPLRDHP